LGSHITRATTELLATGINGLDDILRGGLARNHLYLIEGDPGTGKTTIAIQFLLEGARLGQRGLYITLSESKTEILEIGRSHGWSLANIDFLK
jgi:circadian clock protein KaiC